VYADSSFFVAIYLADTHSPAAQQLLATDASVWFTPFHYAECTHAVAQQVFFGKISNAVADGVYDSLKRDRDGGVWEEILFPENAFELCADLARSHGPKLGMRTLDTLHVACALELKADRFWTFDERQARLAKAQGLKTS
jgi:predicted nucleic acid-binding protein